MLDAEKRFFARVLRQMLRFDEREWLIHMENEIAQLEDQCAMPRLML